MGKTLQSFTRNRPRSGHCETRRVRRRFKLAGLGWIPLVLASTAASTALAGIGNDYGFGPRSAALGGNSTSWNFDGFAAYNNPAGLPLINRSGTGFASGRFSFSYGIVYMDPQFDAIQNVVTANIATGGLPTGTNPPQQFGNVDTSYRSTFGQIIGAAWRADPDWHNLTLGLTIFFPFAQLAYIDTGETYEPEYFLYRDRTQQPDVTFAGGMELTDHLRVGVGMHVAYVLSSEADANVAVSAPTTARFETDIKPKISPYFGLLYSKDDKSSLGLVVRMENSETSNFTVNTTAQAAGFLPSIPVNFLANDTIVYDPLSIELGGSLETSEKTRTYLQLEYQFWSKFQPPYLYIANPTTNAGIPLQPGPQLNFSYRNIVIPRIGEEISLGRWLSSDTKLRLGYAYRPGVIDGPPDDSGNFLDPDKQMLNAGMGFVFQRFLGYRKPWNLDFSLDYQLLVTQTIVKSANDEQGTAGNEKIGAPGYQAGGHVFGGQIAFTLGL